MKLKRLISALAAAAMLAVGAEAYPNDIQMTVTAQAAKADSAGESKLTSEEFVVQACKLVGRKYQLGGKGCSSFSAGKFLPPSQVYSIDCSGLVFWSLGSLGVRAKSPITFYGSQCVLPLNTFDWYNSALIWRNNYGRFVYGSQEFSMKRERYHYSGDYTAAKSKNELLLRQSYWLERKADGKLTGHNISQGSVIIAKNQFRGRGYGDDHAFIYIGEFDSKAELKKYLTETLKVKVSDKYIIEEKHNMADGSTSKHWRIESAGGSGPDEFYGVYINNGVTYEERTYSYAAYSLTEDDTMIVRNFLGGRKVTENDRECAYYTVKHGGMYMQAELTGKAGNEEYWFTGWTSDINKATKFKICEYGDNAYGAKINRIPHSKGSYEVTQYVTALAKADGISASADGVRVFAGGADGYDTSKDTQLGGYDKKGTLVKSTSLSGATWSRKTNSIKKITFDRSKTSSTVNGGKVYVDFNNSRPRSDEANDLINSSVSIEKSRYSYTGKEIKPAPTVTLGSKTLTLGKDYTLSYENNTNAGIASVIIEGIGEYTGKAKKSFMIERIALKNVTLTKAPKYRYYKGKESTPSPKLIYNGIQLKAGSDYIISYTNNNSVGTAGITIKGKGNFKGTLKADFKLLPPATEIKSLTSPAAGKLRVQYKGVSGVTGYQVTYSLSKDFSKAKKSCKTTYRALKLSGLTNGRTYYVKVRTYKTVGGVNYYSGYSDAVKIKA